MVSSKFLKISIHTPLLQKELEHPGGGVGALQRILHAHWLIFFVNKWTDTEIYNLWHASMREQKINLQSGIFLNTRREGMIAG